MLCLAAIHALRIVLRYFGPLVAWASSIVTLIVDVQLVSSLVRASAKQFLLLSSSALIRIVLGLGQSVCQVEEIFWYPDSAKQIELPFLIIKYLVGEKFFDLLSNYWHFENFITTRSHLRGNLDQILDRLGKIV